MKPLSRAIPGLAALALIWLLPAASAENEPEAGSFDVAYVKRNVQPVDEGRLLLLSEATGTNTGGAQLDGFSVSLREIADLDKGNGSNSGYVIFARGDDQRLVKFSGKVSTAIKEGQPNTTMSGVWEVVAASGSLAGTKGEGSYSGYFTAEDRFRIDWKGSSTRSQALAK